jgi:hypothetical protein
MYTPRLTLYFYPHSAGNFAEGAAPGPEKKTFAQHAVGTASPKIRDPTDPDAAQNLTQLEKLQEGFGRLVATGIFFFTKVRIKNILQQVYESVPDADLVRSIELAAEDPGAEQKSPQAICLKNTTDL